MGNKGIYFVLYHPTVGGVVVTKKVSLNTHNMVQEEAKFGLGFDRKMPNGQPCVRDYTC